MTEDNADEFLHHRDPVRLIFQERVPAELMLPLAITAVRATEPHGASLNGRVRTSSCATTAHAPSTTPAW